MRVLPRNGCSHSKWEVVSMCVPQTLLRASSSRLCQPEVHSASIDLGERQEKWHVGVWQGYITPPTADGHIKTPEGSHPSRTMGARGDIRGSVCLNGGTFLFPPCLSILFSAGCFTYSLFPEETPTSYMSHWANRAEGLISSRKVAMQ